MKMISHTVSSDRSFKPFRSHSTLSKPHITKVYNTVSLTDQKPSSDEKTRLKGVLDKFVSGFGQGNHFIVQKRSKYIQPIGQQTIRRQQPWIFLFLTIQGTSLMWDLMQPQANLRVYLKNGIRY